MNPGNSGGPLFNMRGEVIGIASHIVSTSGGSEGLGFVVTSNMARRLLLEAQGIWSGMHLVPLGPDLARLLNVPSPGTGLLVERVAKGSPAEFIGLRGGSVRASIGGRELLLGGDIVLEVLGIPVGRGDAFAWVRARQAELKEGDRVEVRVLRSGREELLQTFFFPSLQE